MRVLVTGGLGFIGSHTVVELIKKGDSVCIVDDLSNSNISVVERLKKVTNSEILFEKCNVRDLKCMSKIFAEFNPEAVIHFAAYKSAGESVAQPLKYYENNIGGSVALLKVMDAHKCRRIIFSSSATVYGDKDKPPFTENSATNPVNPYGNTKLMVESILEDWVEAGVDRIAVALRYFNPIGAHNSGLLGEMPNGIPNNLMPYLCNVAGGNLTELAVFGDDFKTRDGTGERDYLHVVDLAKAHTSTTDYTLSRRGFSTFNVGTGKGTTVFELIQAFEKATGVAVKYKITGRRSGDVACSMAAVAKIKKEMNWTALKTVDDMCRDSWRWQTNISKLNFGEK